MKALILSFAFLQTVLFGNMEADIPYARQPVIPYETITSAVPYSTNYEWIYAVIDGVLCRRLYDRTNQCWVGDWEPCP